MPFSAQKLFPLKYSVLWKLSFEHFFVESALFDILSNRDVRLCSCPPETTCQLCRGISVGVFCTFLVYCQIPWDSIRILDNSGTEKLSPRTVPGGTRPHSGI